ncbi:MAG: ABC transporter permease [Herpetosiphonaceae bacterium]|nr:ABC transporter permease [Herpetosiphonaceae bacterium]
MGRRSSQFLVGLTLLWFAGLLLGPFVIPIDPDHVDLQRFLEHPGISAPLGTDENGRDVLVRVMVGARLSLSIASGATLLALIVGIGVGALAGFTLKSWLDGLLMRLVDACLAVPTILVILIVAAIFGAGPVQLIIIIGLTGWMPVARLVRGQVRELTTLAWVEASKALGVPPTQLLLRGILPALAPILFVAALNEVRRSIVLEATASFLGAGVLPPTASWGNMLIDAQLYLLTAPWLALAPGIALTITLLLIGRLRSFTVRPGSRSNVR